MTITNEQILGQNLRAEFVEQKVKARELTLFQTRTGHHQSELPQSALARKQVLFIVNILKMKYLCMNMAHIGVFD